MRLMETAMLVDYKTDYANLKRLQLPDGSVVIMNKLWIAYW